MKYQYMTRISEPLSQQVIMNILGSLFTKDEEAIWSCVDHYDKLKNDISLFKDILSCAGNKLRCESLISNLDEQQLIHFSKIVLSLKDAIELDDFSKVGGAIFNKKAPTESSINKAKILLDSIMNLNDSDLLTNAIGILNMSDNEKMLAGIYFTYKNKRMDEEFIKQWPTMLGTIAEENLNEMIRFHNLILKNSGYKADLK